MYSVGSWTYDEATTAANFTFASGGFQGSRGDDSASGTYIENVFEELDAPAEWFYNESAGQLYFWMNASGGVPPPTNFSLQVPQVRRYAVPEAVHIVPLWSGVNDLIHRLCSRAAAPPSYASGQELVQCHRRQHVCSGH